MKIYMHYLVWSFALEYTCYWPWNSLSLFLLTMPWKHFCTSSFTSSLNSVHLNSALTQFSTASIPRRSPFLRFALIIILALRSSAASGTHISSANLRIPSALLKESLGTTWSSCPFLILLISIFLLFSRSVNDFYHSMAIHPQTSLRSASPAPILWVGPRTYFIRHQCVRWWDCIVIDE